MRFGSGQDAKAEADVICSHSPLQKVFHRKYHVSFFNERVGSEPDARREESTEVVRTHGCKHVVHVQHQVTRPHGGV